MCTRLYSDVVVASKIVDSYKRTYDFFKDASDAINEVYISINSCLTHQAICRNMGVENVFTGPECGFGKSEWDYSDYKNFFSLLPQYFTDWDETYYKVNLKSMLADVNKEDLSLDKMKKSIRENLLIQGSYSERILSALEL